MLPVKKTELQIYQKKTGAIFVCMIESKDKESVRFHLDKTTVSFYGGATGYFDCICCF